MTEELTSTVPKKAIEGYCIASECRTETLVTRRIDQCGDIYARNSDEGNIANGINLERVDDRPSPPEAEEKKDAETRVWMDHGVERKCLI